MKFGRTLLMLFTVVSLFCVAFAQDANPNSQQNIQFDEPTHILNPYLPLTTLTQDILEGTRSGMPVRIVRTRMKTTKQFFVNGHDVQAILVEDRAYENGSLIEIADDYFGQGNDGTVYYFGEFSTDYKDGHVIDHSGSWLYGKDTNFLGTLLPGKPYVGEKWESENVPSKKILEHDKFLSLSKTITVPAGTFYNCAETQESVKGEGLEEKYYCPSVGVVMEFTSDSDYVALVSHKSNWTLPLP